MYQALYRKYRPTNFNQVAGQQVIVKTLINSILNNKISHAYLFSGPRGTGKTSIAKILAKTINCENLEKFTPCDKCDSCISINNKKSVDIIEIDAASNNGVDEIRELKNNVNLVPNNSKYKVYIIDEVHMLTISAFNALLKTLEEPPDYVVFILATTEIHKVPETILSRCQKFEFKKINIKDLKKRLLEICEIENIKIELSALELIAKYSNGGMRDAINLLDQIYAYKSDKITDKDVLEVCGGINNEQMFEFVDKILKNDIKSSFKLLNKFDFDGKNLILIYDNLIDYLKNFLIYLNVSDYFKDKLLINHYEKLITLTNENEIYNIINILIESSKNMKYESNKKLLAELAIIKIINLRNIKNNSNKQKNEDKNKNNEKISNFKYKINDIDQKKLSKIKQIRVNNALSKFNKKDLLNFIPKIEELSELLINSDYSSLISLVLDGILKIKGNEYLVFVYPNNQFSLYFNSEISKIEKIFYEKYNEKYKVIAINIDEWNNYKIEFNNSLKTGNNKFQFIKEDSNLLNTYIKTDNYINKINDIDNEFNEIVKYV